MEENKNPNGYESNSRLLTREEEIELKHNSVKRIQPFLKKLDDWIYKSLHSGVRC